MATTFFPPYGADHEMTHCPCGHRWLGHGIGTLSEKPGYGRCFVCDCDGVDKEQEAYEAARAERRAGAGG